MTTGQKTLTWVGIAWVVGWAAFFWYSSRVPQKVHVGGVTVQVPFGWVMQTTPTLAEPVGFVYLRRANVPWMPNRPWITAGISARVRPYTMESAQCARARSAAGYGDSAYYSNPKTFDVTSGKYASLCAEGTMSGKRNPPRAQVLTCYVVGTRLLASFMSPNDVDADAERILKSLN